MLRETPHCSLEVFIADSSLVKKKTRLASPRRAQSLTEPLYLRKEQLLGNIKLLRKHPLGSTTIKWDQRLKRIRRIKNPMLPKRKTRNKKSQALNHQR